MIAKLFVVWLVCFSFLVGMAVARIADSRRVDKVVSQYNNDAARLRERLMDLER